MKINSICTKISKIKHKCTSTADISKDINRNTIKNNDNITKLRQSKDKKSDNKEVIDNRKMLLKEKKSFDKTNITNDKILELYCNALIKQINSILESNNDVDDYDLSEQNSSSFYCKELPNISINDYIMRVLLNADINPSTIILIGIYLDKFCTSNNFFITLHNVYR